MPIRRRPVPFLHGHHQSSVNADAHGELQVLVRLELDIEVTHVLKDCQSRWSAASSI